MAIRFANTSAKHRISQARARYVLDHYVWAYPAGRGVTLFMGPDANGIDLEIGTVERDDGTWVIHAMKVRPEFRDEYRSHLPWPR